MTTRSCLTNSIVKSPKFLLESPLSNLLEFLPNHNINMELKSNLPFAVQE